MQSCDSVLDDIAFSTAIDASLASLVALRPHCATAIANQVLYVARVVSQLKAACFEWASTSKVDVAAAMDKRSMIASPLQVRIVIVGCGFVGTAILRRLLESGCFNATSFSVVTRQPQRLSAFSKLGVGCFHEFSQVSVQPDLIVLACQPSQLSSIERSMKGNVRGSTIVLSVCCGIPADKVASCFSHVLCLTTSIDTEGLSRCLLQWTRRDDQALNNGVRECETISARHQDVLSCSFPMMPTEFFCRFMFAMLMSAKARGITGSEALKMAACLLLPQDRHSTLCFPQDVLESSDPSTIYNAFCTIEAISSIVSEPPKETFLALRKRFLACL